MQLWRCRQHFDWFIPFSSAPPKNIQMIQKDMLTLLEEGFDKCYIEDRIAMYKRFRRDDKDCIEIYESSNDGIWEQQYYGVSSYIDKLMHLPSEDKE